MAAGQCAAYRLDNFIAMGCFQKVGRGAQRKGPDYSSVSGEGRQYDDCGVGKFAANGCNGLQAVNNRHLKIDQHHVRKQLSKLLDRLFAVGGLTGDFHIGFLLDDRPQPVSHDRMVIDNEDPESLFDLVQRVTCFPSHVPITRV